MSTRANYLIAYLIRVPQTHGVREFHPHTPMQTLTHAQTRTLADLPDESDIRWIVVYTKYVNDPAL